MTKSQKTKRPQAGRKPGKEAGGIISKAMKNAAAFKKPSSGGTN